MKTKINSFWLLLLIPIICFGHSSVKGTVSEEDSGLPLPGVNVLVKGTNTGPTTAFDG